MIIKNHYIQKSDVKYVTEDFSILEAREFLEKTGYRCVPILDKSKTYFVGNVYEIDTYKYKGSLEDPVTNIAKNNKDFVHEHDPFFRIFFTIRKLPFLAVLDEDDEFVGILTHSIVMDVAEDAFGVRAKGYSITIGTYDFQNTLKRISEIVSKYSSIQTLITLYSEDFVRQIVLTLPEQTEKETVDVIIKELTEAKYSIVHVEKLK